LFTVHRNYFGNLAFRFFETKLLFTLTLSEKDKRRMVVTDKERNIYMVSIKNLMNSNFVLSIYFEYVLKRPPLFELTI
jgi:hypothetical protein